MKIIIVEDDERLQRAWVKTLAIFHGEVAVISAFTVKEAEEKFSANPDVTLIVLDACVPGDDINVLPLLEKMRETFKGPIIAASSSPSGNEILVKAGCDFGCRKEAVVSAIIKMLKLN